MPIRLFADFVKVPFWWIRLPRKQGGKKTPALLCFITIEKLLNKLLWRMPIPNISHWSNHLWRSSNKTLLCCLFSSWLQIRSSLCDWSRACFCSRPSFNTAVTIWLWCKRSVCCWLTWKAPKLLPRSRLHGVWTSSVTSFCLARCTMEQPRLECRPETLMHEWMCPCCH